MILWMMMKGSCWERIVMRRFESFFLFGLCVCTG
jgi:hypothetical protein